MLWSFKAVPGVPGWSRGFQNHISKLQRLTDVKRFAERCVCMQAAPRHAGVEFRGPAQR